MARFISGLKSETEAAAEKEEEEEEEKLDWAKLEQPAVVDLVSKFEHDDDDDRNPTPNLYAPKLLIPVLLSSDIGRY